MIKNILAGFGVAYIMVMLTTGFLYERWKSLDKTSSEYAMDAASFVFANWDFEELKRRADSRMFINNDEATLKRIFASLSRLGALQSVNGCQGKSAVNIGSGMIIVATYSCEMAFEKDKVIATMVLTGNPGGILIGSSTNSWRILALDVNSAYLAKPKPAK
jgi:hypothetical protein